MTRNQYSLILWLFSIVSPFALIPFERAITHFLDIEPIGLTALGSGVAAIEGAVIYGLMIYFGMQWSTALGARFLVLEKHPNLWRDLLKPGLIAGIVGAVAILLTDALLPASPLNLLALGRSVPPCVGFFCLFFCIINQQVFLSMFCIAGITILLKKIASALSNNTQWMLSIIITSLLFGLFHIPIFVRPEMPDMALVIMRIMVLTLFSGVTFGMLFWKKSFETAVWGHVVVDAILYVGVPLYALYIG